MRRFLLIFSHDVAAAAAAWVLAHWLRFNMDIPATYLRSMWETLVWVVPVQALIFLSFGLYRGIWRYATLRDFSRVLAAVAIAALVTLLLLITGVAPGVVPRSVFVLDPILLLAIMSGSRIAFRAWKEHKLYGALRHAGQPVIILGAGEIALTLVRELRRSSQWHVVGFLDDDSNKAGRLVDGIMVYGGLEKLPELAARLGVQHAIIAMPSVSHQARRRAMQICSSAKVKALTVPSYEDLVSGRVKASVLREVELDDLLGRDPVRLDTLRLHQALTDRVVMVTGAGGSIGSELCRQIAAFQPRLLVMLDLSELALYTVEQEFDAKHPELGKACVIGDVKDAQRIREIMVAHKPEIVFHAAAYKHVPLMENDNTWMGVRNNVLGTYVVATTAAESGARQFVLISTDKAVNPANVMGATKRLAETVCQALQRETEMSLVAVRFGNVLGSTGSVIPKFREQIARGGPITVTHPDIIRFFMSIPEAAQLVLQAGVMGQDGEIFLLDMGEPVRIVDLARDMIRLSGLAEEQIEIVFTGLRPGEKLFEELVGFGEQSMPTPHPKLRVVRSTPPPVGLLEKMIPWLQATQTLSDSDTKDALSQWVREYQPAQAQPSPLKGTPPTASRHVPEHFDSTEQAHAVRS
ncbi:MAG TPA: nucleoside-diphosphate sugar epimerase/dehydratase [Burkholderiales bacterium]|nr:nucleoside-diphosphate sugar epimerase/dehydratase [Burkholderiales bacterium]